VARPGGAPVAEKIPVARPGQSCSSTLSSELWICRWPLYSMKPNLLNLFMKWLTLGRVVPMISASVA
jgi:hypothetical protein